MLYHFSENPHIKIFHPHTPEGSKHLPPAVWAIDERHQVNYFFPRDCPRIIYRMSPDVSEADKKKFFSGTKCSAIITIEEKWLQSLNDTILYKYSFLKTGFSLMDATAGYYTSSNEVQPVSVERLDNLPERIKERNAELRLTDNIRALQDQILNSTITYFSIIRMKNAK